MFCIIYLLRNRVNNLIYVGQTWRTLKARFRAYSKTQPHLFNAIKLYGKDQFFYEVLTVAGTQETADYWEKYFINKYNSTDPEIGYNLKAGGKDGIYVNRRINEETRKQWIEKLRANAIRQYEENPIVRMAFEENRFELGRKAPNKGVPMSTEQYNKWLPFAFKKGESISSDTEFKPGMRPSIATEFKLGHTPYNKGQEMSAEQKIKCAPTMFKPGQTPHNKKQFSDEEKREIILLYSQGNSITSIAKRYNCSFQPINRVINN
jgi:group I intron endonuclease